MCMLQTWATVVKDASELTNEELRASFDLIDVDGNGRLNAKELEVRDRPHSNLTLPPPSPPMRAPCGPPTPRHGPNHTGGDPKRRSAAGPDGTIHMRGIGIIPMAYAYTAAVTPHAQRPRLHM